MASRLCLHSTDIATSSCTHLWQILPTLSPLCPWQQIIPCPAVSLALSWPSNIHPRPAQIPRQRISPPAINPLDLDIQPRRPTHPEYRREFIAKRRAVRHQRCVAAEHRERRDADGQAVGDPQRGGVVAVGVVPSLEGGDGELWRGEGGGEVGSDR